ncbi:DUF305 domain-containing protein [Kitasatospora sp. NPDC057223]|uniref:DUF305 domain-containing protein n=1 Tax=Kitasatospora sp. NPDC057223 TaxID=3346055 RepID=UPI0036258B27
MRRAFIGAAVASLAVCGALAAVALPGAGAAPGPVGAPASAGSRMPSAASAFNPTDVAWLQLAAPMTEQAVRLAALVADRAASPQLRELATAVGAADGAELARLNRLLAQAGADRDRPHEGHDMPGMTTPAEYAAAEQESGPAFDRLVSGHLREYLEQSVHLAGSEGSAGREPATRELAADIGRSRAAELARLVP